MNQRLFGVFIIMILLAIVTTGCPKKGKNIVVLIRSTIDEYTPTMSSVPGLPLTVDISGGEDQDIEYIWKTEEGTFLSWHGPAGKIVTLGNRCTIKENEIYWSPSPNKEIDTESFKINVEVKNIKLDKIIGREVIIIDCSKEARYSIKK